MKRSLIILLLLLMNSSFAYDCSEVIGKKFYTPGDSDFQYEYSFLKEGVLELKIFMTSHDVSEKKMETEVHKGSYKINKGKLQVVLKVRSTLNKITYSCEDRDQYMGVGDFSKSIKPELSSPGGNSFSYLSFWPEGSSVIRKMFNAKN